MSKRRGRKAFATKNEPVQQPAAAAQAFSFGDATPVLDKREILDYAECIHNGRWYEPPVSFDGLARSLLGGASQLANLCEAQYSGLDLYPASDAESAGVQ